MSVLKGETATFIRLIGFLSGGFSTEKVAQLLNLSVDSVRNTVEKLISVGLVYDYSEQFPVGEISKQDFLFSVSALTSEFRFDMFRHPLFAQLAEREILFLATAIEYGHIIRDASRHIGRALSAAPAHLRDLLKVYLKSEQDHYLALEASLTNALTTECRFDDLEPLASTEALILKTRALAESDTLAYIACCGAFEANCVPEPSAFISQWKPTIASVFEVLRQHAAEDCSSDHSTLFEQALTSVESVDADTVVRVCDALHTYKHYFDNLNYEILRVYSYDNVVLPRLRPHLQDFIVAQ